MISIHKNTLNDLEFDIVLTQVETHWISDLGKDKVLHIKPFNNKEDVLYALNQVNEYHASFENDNRIPNHGFDDISSELRQLQIENNYLEIEGFRKIASISSTVNSHIVFFKKFNAVLPGRSFVEKSTLNMNLIGFCQPTKRAFNYANDSKNDWEILRVFGSFCLSISSLKQIDIFNYMKSLTILLVEDDEIIRLKFKKVCSWNRVLLDL